jgi:hypothetical protein
MTLSKLRESKIAKYDIALKRLFSLRNGTLRSILGVPDGVFLREEFPNLEFRRADALVYSDTTIHHIEFQTKNDSSMPARLHEYAYLIERYKDSFGVADVTNLTQQVVYVGSNSNTMKPPYAHWGTTHTFRSIDIREKYDADLVDRLWSSGDPDDWIAGLLLLPRDVFSEGHVVEVAKSLASPEWTGWRRIEDTKVLLLIAAILRKVEHAKLLEIEKMLMVNIGASSLLAEMYDKGGYETAIKQQLDLLERLMDKRGVFFTAPQREYLSQFNFEAIENLIDLAMDGDFATIKQTVTPSSGLSMSPDG